jgi:hypothetical protein
LTVTVCAAIKRLPDRTFVPVFGENVTLTEPAPVPPVGETLIQVGSLTDADHEPVHPGGPALTVKDIVDPPAGGLADSGLTEKLHVGGTTVMLTDTTGGVQI